MNLTQIFFIKITSSHYFFRSIQEFKFYYYFFFTIWKNIKTKVDFNKNKIKSLCSSKKLINLYLFLLFVKWEIVNIVKIKLRRTKFILLLKVKSKLTQLANLLILRKSRII